MNDEFIDAFSKIMHPIRSVERPYPYFEPTDRGTFDRFGNRILQSPFYSFTTKEETHQSAALLLSPEGQTLVRKHKGLLRMVDRGIARITSGKQDYVNWGEGENQISLETMDLSGTQSEVYLLIIGKERYLIKKMKWRENVVDSDDVRQPYINAMLQAQAVQRDCGTELGEIKVRLPTYLFASINTCCVRFEEGQAATAEDLKPKITGLTARLVDYIDEAEKSSSLWKGVVPDCVSLEPVRIRTENFIKARDGKFVLVNPFFQINNPEEAQKMRKQMKRYARIAIK